MGSSSSVHRKYQPTNMMKNHLALSKTENILLPPSPIKPNIQNENFVVYDAALNPHSLTHYADHNGSKEEAFFDSKGWLDSDCEDDFYSVKGEFTPSRGSTPVHHTFGTLAVNKTPSEQMIPEPSPTQKKKNLLELFRESVRENQNDDVENTCGNEKKEVKETIHDLPPKSAQSTPYISGGNSACSSERTMNGDLREKPVKYVQCCLPRSFSGRKRRTSPAIAANGNA